METIQLIINFGKWVVDKNPNSKVQINTAIDAKGKEFVSSVNVPMKLVQTGKQVIKMPKKSMSGLNIRELAGELGLNYISHSII